MKPTLSITEVPSFLYKILTDFNSNLKQPLYQNKGQEKQQNLKINGSLDPPF